MSQISMPIRIVAVAAIALIAAYMTVLKPKSSTPAAPAATPATTPAGNVNTGKPAVTGFGKAVQAAQGAAKAEENQAKANAGEATTPATGSATPSTSSSSATKSGSATTAKGTSAAPSVPAADLAGLPRPVQRAVHRHQVMALLFWNGRSADDRAVRSALRHVHHFDGTVYTHAAPMSSIARYGRITRGADLQQSPTVVVVDRKLRATSLVGYVDVDTIDQAVVDALRATGGLFNDHYLARINGVCSASSRHLWAMPKPETVPQVRHEVRAFVHRADRFFADFAAVPAPKKWRGLKKASIADLNVVKASNHRLMHSLTRGHVSVKSLRGELVTEYGAVSPAQKRFDHRMGQHGLIFCQQG